ncbi:MULTISPECIES: biotin/lipoyl-binding carrier protein [Janibacter]|uniref:Acetyl-CoA carboxylase biotin carboxyl carrier protein subunit n=1 Tax=Janibacter hoylei PVAS-1 TaxID=1210046 RepID=K1DZT6_9MICO|nr:biotin/lipoyl-binding carrier protein [Janibacter hoylei]EKA61924.1 pyruvate carboxylase [Janibacter hoylei PVAS-1]MCT1620295.1 biotin/lipoyl-binding carrier protein [Janibacter hoylei]MCT2292120.1 biotin/lipoyl-binding carrier protein [Janibacter hoylei]MCW4601760.1 biotin/lipoyl-binding carrier protein [Janibacter hoylei]RWU84035.1 acetyl-CoA carboxylase biotin carboxyl carrier protein subunit [Janibacter hoylei PVAS-1]
MGHRVESELVANVIAVQVAADQVVAVGDELVLLESMKMEIPVLSERSGRVAEVKVAPGDVVQEGEVLVVIDD